MRSAHIQLVSSTHGVATIEQYSNYDPTDYEQWLDDLRGQVWNDFIKGRRDLSVLAAMAHLNLVTVQKFAWGDTRFPMFKTVFEIAKAIGFRLPMIPQSAPRQPDELDLRPQTAQYRQATASGRPIKNT